MLDITEEQKMEARPVMITRLQALNTEEAIAMVHLCLAIGVETNRAKLIAQWNAVQSLLGPMSLPEKMVIAEVVRIAFPAYAQLVNMPETDFEIQENTEGRV